MEAVDEIKELQETVNAHAEIDDKVLLKRFGITLSSDESSESSDSVDDSEVDDADRMHLDLRY